MATFKATSSETREQACRWLARLDAGLSHDDRKRLQRWLRAKPQNPGALLEMARLWDAMEVLGELRELFPLPQQGASHQRAGTARRRLLIPAAVSLATAAALLAAWMLGVSPPFPASMPSSPTPAIAQHHQTAVGEQQSLILSDGSRVVLNTNTRLEVHYTTSARTLTLHRGEAHFTVEPDPRRPLRVQAGERTIEVVGTAFNIHLPENGELHVLVTSGRVNVINQPGSDDAAIVLDAAHALHARERDHRIETLEPADIDIRLAWQRGIIIFRDEPLQSALEEISRYTAVRFDYPEEISNTRVAGYFRAGDIDGLITALQSNFQIDAQYIQPDLISLQKQ